MHDIFLSYNREDQAIARRFADGFQREGCSVWWDQALKSGEAYDRVTEQALRDAKAVVVLWSKRSVNSDWVRAEATIALRNKTLAPVMIEACERPIMFELTQTADLCHWQGAADDKSWQAFVADVRHFIGAPRAAGGVMADASRHTATASVLSSKPQSPKRAAMIAAGAIALLAILGGIYSWQRAPSNASEVVSEAAAATSTQAVTEIAISSDSLAVLPFANFSPDEKDAYFAAGLHEEILNQLAKISKLKVISRQSVVRYADSQLSAPEIAKELRVAHIMEGSVRYANDRIRVTAQLIDATTDQQLWSETFELNFSDIFAAESQIAMNVANAMRISFSDEERAALEKIPTQSSQAYALYLEALSLRLDFLFGDTTAADRAQQLLDQAIALDPIFAVAYWEKAQIHLFHQQIPQARDYAGQAVALDLGVGSVEFMEIQLLFAEFKYAEAASRIDAFLNERPNDAVALSVGVNAHRGIFDSAGALALAQRRYAIEQTAGSAGAVAIAYSRLGRHQEAVAYFQQALQLFPEAAPGQLEFAYTLAALGRTEDAVVWINRIKDEVLGNNEEKNAGGNLYSGLIYANALAGRDAEAQRLFVKFQQEAEAGSDIPTKARAYISVGELAEGLALLQQMITDKNINNASSSNAYEILKLNPHHLPALDLPEFVEARNQL